MVVGRGAAMGAGPENESAGSRQAWLGQLARDYARALLAADEVAAETAIRTAMDAGAAMDEIDDEIIAPALWLIGELWERGEISVADEHLATGISLRVLALQREAHRLRVERGSRRVLLAAPAGERHVVALSMVANLLADARYHVLMLGADVPIDALAAAAVRHRSDVVALTATMASSEDQMLVAIRAVEQACPGAGIVIGGRAVTSRLRGRPGIEACTRVSDAVEAVDATIQRAAFN
jgi:methanogenic corrinoid protein MtbC1